MGVHLLKVKPNPVHELHRNRDSNIEAVANNEQRVHKGAGAAPEPEILDGHKRGDPDE